MLNIVLDSFAHEKAEQTTVVVSVVNLPRRKYEHLLGQFSIFRIKLYFS